MTVRRLFLLWDGGMDNAPPLVRLCLERWQALNPGWDVSILDGSDLGAYLDTLEMPTDRIPIEKAANLLRLHLLREHGGVWADATLFPVAPLESFVPSLVAPGGYFAFVGSERRRPWDSWFIATDRPGHLLIERHQALYLDFWRRPRRRPRPTDLRWLCKTRADAVWSVDPDGGRSHPAAHYFAFQFHFDYLLRTDPEFAAAWSQVPKRAALVPLLLKRAARRMRPDDWLAAAPGLLALSPVHKLDWKKPLADPLLAFLSAYRVPDETAEMAR